MTYILEAKKDFNIMGTIVLEGETIKASQQTLRTLGGHMVLYNCSLGWGRDFAILKEEIQWGEEDNIGTGFKFVGVDF